MTWSRPVVESTATAVQLRSGFRSLLAASGLLLASMGRPAGAVPAEFERAERELRGWYEHRSGVAERRVRAPRTSLHVYAGAGLGRGLRLNNPFRLAKPLGRTGESLSLTAPFADFMLGVAAGPVSRVQHGGVVHLSIAVDGVPQQVVSPGYGALLRISRRSLALARISSPLVLSPELTSGVEAAVGVAGLVRAGVGLELELTASLFGGAATWERAGTRVPVLAAQLATIFDWELLL